MSRSSSRGLLTLQAAARDYRAGGVGPKATLLVLVEAMGNFQGEWKCNPGTDTLAEQTEQSVGTVRRHLLAFEAAGLITKRTQGRPGGGRGDTEFVLNEAVLLRGANAHLSTLGVEPESADRAEPTRSQRAANAQTGDPAPHIGTVGTVRTVKDPAASAAVPLELVVEEEHPALTTGQRAQTILAAHIDWCRAQKPPRAKPARPGQAAQTIRLMLEAGHSDADVEWACTKGGFTTAAMENAIARRNERAKPDRNPLGPGSTTINDAWAGVPSGKINAKAVR